MPIDLGTLPDWIAAISTAGALAAASVAAVAANKQLRHLEELERARDTEARRSQASKIAVWLEHDLQHGTSIYFGNRSELPIYGVTIVCHTPWGVITHTSYPMLGPTVTPIRLRDVLDDIKATATPETMRNWREMVSAIRLGIAFQDAAETPWARHPHGALTETGMPAAAVGALEEGS